MKSIFLISFLMVAMSNCNSPIVNQMEQVAKEEAIQTEKQMQKDVINSATDLMDKENAIIQQSVKKKNVVKK